MAKQLRIIRNAEAGELLSHICDDDAMMIALRISLQEFWQQYKALFAAASHSTWDPSPMLIPPTTNLIIALVEGKINTLKASPELRLASSRLEKLLMKASLYPVADEILKICLPAYRSMAESGQFELIDDTTPINKPWWQFW